MVAALPAAGAWAKRRGAHLRALHAASVKLESLWVPNQALMELTQVWLGCFRFS